MSKPLGGIDKLRQQLKPNFGREREIVEAGHFSQVEAERQFRQELRAIKDRLDLFGERALTEEEKAIVKSRPAFFYPGERR